jgi:HAMP domain-containing protein
MTQDVRSKEGAIFISVRVKLLLTFTLLFIISFAAIFVWFYNFATSLAMEDLRADLMATAMAAQAGIDGDAHTALYESGEMDDETYTEISNFLRSIKYTNPKAAGIYTYIQEPDEPDQVRFVVSAALPPDVEPSERDLAAAEQSRCAVPPSSRPDLGQAYGWDAGLSPTMLNGVREAGAETALWADEWGEWLSGYAPIYNSEGETVGAVGVDMCAADVVQLQQSIRGAILPVFGISLIVLSGLVFAVAHGISRPISALTRAAEGVGHGDYDQDFANLYSGRFRDEVATLAEVFEMMVDKVRERERRLKQRVEDLQIIIDERKRKKHVQEITDNEFFRDLQARARVLRAQVQEKDEEEKQE